MENDFFLNIQTPFYSLIYSCNQWKVNRIKTLSTVKVPVGKILNSTGNSFLTMLVKLVLTTIVSHIGKTTSSTCVLQLS